MRSTSLTSSGWSEQRRRAAQRARGTRRARRSVSRREAELGRGYRGRRDRPRKREVPPPSAALWSNRSPS